MNVIINNIFLKINTIRYDDKVIITITMLLFLVLYDYVTKSFVMSLNRVNVPSSLEMSLKTMMQFISILYGIAM
jgi:hypothetical protein